MVRWEMTNKTTLPWRWDERSWNRGLSLELKAHIYLYNWREKVHTNTVIDTIVGIGNLGNFHLRALAFYSNEGVA